LMVGFGLAYYMAWRFSRGRWLAFGLMAVWMGLEVLICFSRIYLRAHYLSDVVGGFALGAAWLALACAILERWPNQKMLPSTNAPQTGTPQTSAP